MRFGKFIFKILPAGVLLLGSLQARAQQPLSTRAGGSAEGRLTVTLTVVSSVGLVAGPDGEQRLIIANAVDPKDNVSRLQPVVAVALKPIADGDPHVPRKKKKAADHR
jgi:hypothetical protein